MSKDSFQVGVVIEPDRAHIEIHPFLIKSSFFGQNLWFFENFFGSKKSAQKVQQDSTHSKLILYLSWKIDFFSEFTLYIGY